MQWICILSIEKPDRDSLNKIRLIQVEAWAIAGESNVRWATCRGFGGNHEFLMVRFPNKVPMAAFGIDQEKRLKRLINNVFGQPIWKEV